MPLSAAGARRVVVGDSRYVRTERALYKRHICPEALTIRRTEALRGPDRVNGLNRSRGRALRARLWLEEPAAQ